MNRIYYNLIFILLSYPLYSQTNIRILDHKSNVTIKRLDILNSKYRETNISITPDGKYIFFMSDRGGQKWTGKISTHYKKPGYDGDIWFSKKVDFTWTVPYAINPPVNSSSGEDEPLITPDGQHVYFQSWAGKWQDKNMGGPYYKATLNGENWTDVKGLGDSITIFFKLLFYKNLMAATDGMAISPDENVFLVASGNNYEGNMDIFMSKKNINGNWGQLNKLTLSTDSDERSIFIAADGKTIYFASNGYGGFGGMDIFKTTLDRNGNHSEIVNIGKPFNTEKDDYGFIITASGDKAYFIREGDIYSAVLTEANKEIKPFSTKTISGKLSNTEGKPVVAEVTLSSKSTKNILAHSASNSSSGEFSLVSPETVGEFELKIAAAHKSETTTRLTFVNQNTYEDFDIDYVFTKDSMRLSNFATTITVYFDYDKSELKEVFKNAIHARLGSYSMSKISNIVICGFTDGDGSIEYNQDLGLKRAQAVSGYLKSLNLNANKLKSFGKLKPIAPNNSDEGKSINRRVEITINYSF